MQEKIDSDNEQITRNEIFDGSDEAGLEEIRNLEKETFDWEVSEEDLDGLVDKIKDSSNIILVIKDKENKIIGYLVATPSIIAKEEISSEDAEFESSDKKLYIDTLAISENNRGSILQIKDLFKNLATEASARSYNLISAHIPTNHLPLYERFSEVEVLRKLEDWFGSGEDHYYIEVKI